MTAEQAASMIRMLGAIGYRAELHRAGSKHRVVAYIGGRAVSFFDMLHFREWLRGERGGEGG